VSVDLNFGPVDSKVEQAKSEFGRMCKIIVPPPPTPFSNPRAFRSLTPEWNRDFDAALNAFLSATRSVPNIISNRFGYDLPDRNPWLKSLDRGARPPR